MIPIGDRDQQLLERVAPALFDGLDSESLCAKAVKCLPHCASRRMCRIVTRHEGGVGRSRALRRQLLTHDGVVLGAWSYISNLRSDALPANTVIGRYVSIGPDVTIANENHPLDHFSTSPLFYDPLAGLVRERRLPPRPMLAIGHDVWIGAHACILPRVRFIGHGAVIGAGAVVTKNVPPLAIVAGNPATIIRSRFEGEAARDWLASHWWRHPPARALESCERGLASAQPPRLADELEESDRAFEALFATKA